MDVFDQIGKMMVEACRERTPVRTGKLRKSLRAQIMPNAITVVTDVDYAKFVHGGTARMVARPFLVIGPEEEQAIIERLSQEAVERLESTL